MNDYQINLEIIDSTEKSEEESSVAQSYNWMQENHSLLKNIDQSMLINKQQRVIEITQMNIAKNEHYYLMDAGKKIILQHGDILQLPKHKVRVSLLRPSMREESIIEQENVINKVIGYKSIEFNRVIQKDESIVEQDRFLKARKESVVRTNLDYKCKSNKSKKTHNLVPSTSAFTTPTYQSSEDVVTHKQHKKIKQERPGRVEIQKVSTIASAIRPLDQIDALYAKSQQVKKSETNDLDGGDHKSFTKVNKLINRIFNKTKEVI